MLDGRIIPGSKLESALDVMGEETVEGLMVVEEDDNGVYNLELNGYLKSLVKITIIFYIIHCKVFIEIPYLCQ